MCTINGMIFRAPPCILIDIYYGPIFHSKCTTAVQTAIFH